MIELCKTYYKYSLIDDYNPTDYNVTYMEDDEPQEFIGVFETRYDAIEHIKTLY